MVIERLDRSDRDIAYLEGQGVQRNFFRSKMLLVKPTLVERGPPGLRRLMSAKIRCDIFHSSYYRLSRKARRNVVTIHDFINELFPSRISDRLLAFEKRRACENADRIVCVSRKTRSDLLRYYPSVNPDRVVVIYNGVDRMFFPEPVAGDSVTIGRCGLRARGYLLYVGTRGYCKNFPYVLKILSVVHQRVVSCPLVIVGGPALSASERDLGGRLGLTPESLIHLPMVTGAQLRLLYSNCLALLIPSLYEGFGFPAAEAARCGALVLASRSSSLAEVVGETDYGFDLSRTGEIERVINLGLEGGVADCERDRLRAHAAQFDWDRSVDELLGLYDEVGGG